MTIWYLIIIFSRGGGLKVPEPTRQACFAELAAVRAANYYSTAICVQGLQERN